MRKLYASRENRDKAYRDLLAAGRQAKRSSTRGQRLHPMYIEDVPSGDTGFGNQGYLETWAVLYGLEEIS